MCVPESTFESLMLTYRTEQQLQLMALLIINAIVALITLICDTTTKICRLVRCTSINYTLERELVVQRRRNDQNQSCLLMEMCFDAHRIPNESHISKTNSNYNDFVAIFSLRTDFNASFDRQPAQSRLNQNESQ